ncbi:DUF3099 domain-containing protein [Microbacterium sp. gxy059]|uniref:DUF3099 domain-containing protein n=1 Tax=Microbacterium sp. gxy059 TaxID=2957199 RepID=UPI003D96203A
MKKHKQPAQSATSIETSPHDDETSRMKQYALTMGVRTLCVVLMFVVQPWGWHTLLFALLGAVLPYFAVIVANQAQAGRVTTAVPPATSPRALPAPEPRDDAEGAVIRIAETAPSENRDDA